MAAVASDAAASADRKRNVLLIDGGYLYFTIKRFNEESGAVFGHDPASVKQLLKQIAYRIPGENGDAYFDEVVYISTWKQNEAVAIGHDRREPPFIRSMRQNAVRVENYPLKTMNVRCTDPKCRCIHSHHPIKRVVQAGVDVAIATCMFELVLKGKLERLVLLAGDGDFEAAVKLVVAQGIDLALCCSRETTSARLLPHCHTTRGEPDIIHLEDVWNDVSGLPPSRDETRRAQADMTTALAGVGQQYVPGSDPARGRSQVDSRRARGERPATYAARTVAGSRKTRRGKRGNGNGTSGRGGDGGRAGGGAGTGRSRGRASSGSSGGRAPAAGGSRGGSRGRQSAELGFPSLPLEPAAGTGSAWAGAMAGSGTATSSVSAAASSLPPRPAGDPPASARLGRTPQGLGMVGAGGAGAGTREADPADTFAGADGTAAWGQPWQGQGQGQQHANVTHQNAGGTGTGSVPAHPADPVSGGSVLPSRGSGGSIPPSYGSGGGVPGAGMPPSLPVQGGAAMRAALESGARLMASHAHAAPESTYPPIVVGDVVRPAPPEAGAMDHEAEVREVLGILERPTAGESFTHAMDVFRRVNFNKTELLNELLG